MGQSVEGQPLLDRTGDDESALADLYTQHGPFAYGLAVGIVRDGTAAEEIVCAAFLETWVGGTDSRTTARDVRSRLLAVVHRRAAEFVRSSYPRPEHKFPQPGLLPDWLALERETAWGMLCQLPDTERQVLELAYFGCYTLTEIATRLALPVGTVGGHLRAGLDRLAEQQREVVSPR